MSDEKNSYRQLLPYTGAGLVFLGVLKLYVYYKSFGINIINFLEPSEILTLFFDQLILFVFLIVTLLFIVFQSQFYYNLTKKFEFLRLANDKYFKYYITTVFTAAFIWWSYPLYIEGEMILILWYVAIYMVSVVWIFKFMFKEVRIGTFPISYYLSAYVVVGCVVILFTAREIDQVKYKQANSGVKVVLDNISFPFNNYYYIGKTKNFIFFYNDSLQKADIYPMNRVRKLETDINTVN